MADLGSFGEALRGMADRPFLASRNWSEQQHRAMRDLAHPDILEFEKVFIRRMSKLDVPMFAVEIWRSSKRQDELYRLGNSKAKGGSSPHQYGLAVDLVHSVKAWNLPPKAWALIGHVGEELIAQKGLALEWGGRWKGFYDPAHWQVVGWKQQKDAATWQTRNRN